MSVALALRPDGFTPDQVELIKRTICKGATDDELSLFVQTANRMRLDPFARQIFAIKRYVKKENREVMSIQVSIDGFRLTAERTGHYAGQLGPLWTADGKEWVEVWLDTKKPPAAAKVGVMRHDFKEPIWAVATWAEYKQETSYGLSPMWSKMSALMIAKCAESLALRRAFPNELSGAYTPEEMAQATGDDLSEKAAEYTPPAAKEEAKASGPKETAAPTTTTGPTTSRTSSTTSPEETRQLAKEYVPANKIPVKAGDVMANAAQVDRINELRVQCLDEQSFRLTWLAAYKKHDGVRCEKPAELTFDQASNLLKRMTAHAGRQASRMERNDAEVAANLGAVVGNGIGNGHAAPSLEDALMKAFRFPDDEKAFLREMFGKPEVRDLDQDDCETALALLMAGYGSPEYADLLTKCKTLGRVL